MDEKTFTFLTYQLRHAGRLLSSDLRLLHGDPTKRGKPRKVWYNSGRKHLQELKGLLLLAEIDLDEQEQYLEKSRKGKNNEPTGQI